jgi:hypothetical protein
MSVGSFESYAADAAKFPASVIGRVYDGYPSANIYSSFYTVVPTGNIYRKAMGEKT